MARPRSYLFVPGQRPDRFAKAAASGADTIILDLEDAVGAEFKDAARGNIVDWFAAGGQGVVRINGAETPWFAEDIAAMAACPEAVIMVPKADPETLRAVSAMLPRRKLIALVETVAGWVSLREGASVPGVVRLAFGNLDFGSDARIPGGGAVLDPARFEIVIASRLAGLPPPIEGVTVAIGEADALTQDIAHARALGFTAKLCIHPVQVVPVNAGFSPSESEIAWARGILAALEAAGGSVVQVDGKMVDRPMINQARLILGEAGAITS